MATCPHTSDCSKTIANTYYFGPDYPEETYVTHGYPEQTVDLGEVVMNYATAGPDSAPVILLIPGQTESWWGYETVMKLLASEFKIYAVDLRGQGRSTRTPGRYTLDNMGNDLVRFMLLVIKKPCIISGLSSGGILSCWLSAYAPPGLVRAAYYEDAPLFYSHIASPAELTNRGSIFALFSEFLGDQWSIGNWQGFAATAKELFPLWMATYAPNAKEPPQNLKEYDPEWAKSFASGAGTSSCNDIDMLKKVKVPVLFTHHFRMIHPDTGKLLGAISDQQVNEARQLIENNGQRFEYHSFPEVGHAMHIENPTLYVETLKTWIKTL